MKRLFSVVPVFWLFAILAGGGGVHAQRSAISEDDLGPFFFEVAQLLHERQTSVRRQQELVRVPSPLEDKILRSLRIRYEEYARTVASFRSAASEMVAEPRSKLALFRAWIEGQRSCWTLDTYHRQIETWGSGDLQDLLPSREACARFRTVAFHPDVEKRLQEGLVEQVYQREEIRRLRDELIDLRGLVDDLVEIDSRP